MARIDYPLGKQLWIHQIRAAQLCEGIPFSNVNASREVDAVADRALDLGLHGVVIKVQDGMNRYNLRRVLYPFQYADDLVAPLTQAFQDRGLHVVAYHYTYGNYHEQEAQAFAQRYFGMGVRFDGAMINAEKEYQNGPDRARRYAAELRKLMPNECIGLSTYRWPSSHRDFPYAQFAPYIDYWNPQIYWVFNGNAPSAQLLQSLLELREIAPLPIVPSGYLYSEHGDQPSREELADYRSAVEEFSAEGLMLPGNIDWEWWNAWRTKHPDGERFWEGLRAWNFGPELPEPTPPEPVEPWTNEELTREVIELDQRMDSLEGILGPQPAPAPALPASPAPSPRSPNGVSDRRYRFDFVNGAGQVPIWDAPRRGANEIGKASRGATFRLLAPTSDPDQEPATHWHIRVHVVDTPGDVDGWLDKDVARPVLA